jgi:hypothetical protein
MHSDDPSIRIAAMHAAAAAALDDAGIRRCRLRPTRGGSEDDLLVPAGMTAAVDRALARAGFLPIRRLGRGTHRAYHAVDRESGAWAKVDVVTQIDLGPWQEVHTALAEGFLARATPGSGDPTTDADLDPDDAFWALVMHELWDRPTPAVRRPDDLRALAAAARADGPAAEALRSRLPAGTDPAWVIDRARDGDSEALAQLGRRMRAKAGIVARVRRIVARAARWIDRRDPPFVRRGGSVALLGPDGTGKSTLSKGVMAGGPVAVHGVYLGLYGGHRDRGSGPRLPGVGFAGRLSRMWRGWLVGRSHVARGRLVVFDRHPLEARSTLGGARRAPIGRRLLARSLPMPDVIVVLDAPAEVLYARKPEHPVDRLDAQRSAYLALAGRLRGATVVDVDRPADEVARNVASIVWTRLAERRSGR